MQQMMRKMGIQQTEIDATEVVIKTLEKEIVISNPQVSKVNMMGQDTYQILGNVSERLLSSEPEINEDDVKTVVEQTGASEEKAKETISKHKGDLASAILELKGEENK